MRRILAVPMLFACALAAQTSGAATAGQPMGAAEFEAYATGKTLTYGAGGLPYGIEQYLPGRRVIWAFVGEECRTGTWYEEAGHICFVYENEPVPQCWEFTLAPGGLRARFAGDPADAGLVEVEQSPEPMHCPGPDVGA